MPDITAFSQLAAGHGVGIAVLVIACCCLGRAVLVLWRENRALCAQMQELLSARIAALEKLLEERANEATRSSRY